MSDQTPVPCQKCNGSGSETEWVTTENEGPQPISVTCTACGGSGRA